MRAEVAHRVAKRAHKKVRTGREPVRAGLRTAYCLLQQRTAYCYCTAAPLTAPANFNCLLPAALCLLPLAAATTHNSLSLLTATATTLCVVLLQLLPRTATSQLHLRTATANSNHSLRTARTNYSNELQGV